MGIVRREKWITRRMVRAHPLTVFVFGDNMRAEGFGGQAKEMRGERNVYGIPTKWSPGTRDIDYFSDEDMDNPHVVGAISASVTCLQILRLNGVDIVLPEDGIGTGRAELAVRAPKVLAYINRLLEEMEGDA